MAEQRNARASPAPFLSSVTGGNMNIETNNYTPGPGFYNKNDSAFSKEFIKAEDNQNLYYVIENGTLLRKIQAFGANKKSVRPDIPKEQKLVPGPGQYSPHSENKHILQG